MDGDPTPDESSTALWILPTVLGTPPPERWGHSAVQLENKMYIFGGCFGGQHFSNVISLDLDTCEWSRVTCTGRQPGARDSHTATLVGRCMLVFGGTDGVQKVNDFHVLDLDELTWSTPSVNGTPPRARESHSATLVGSDKLVVFGGSAEGEGNYLNDLHILDVTTMTWHSPVVQGEGPSRRDSHAASSVGHRLVVLGGDCGEQYLGGVDIFDTETCTWTKLETSEGVQPGMRAGHSAITFKDKIYVFGGVGDNAYYNDVWALDILSAQWTRVETTGASPKARFSHTACLTGTDVLIYGGCGEDEHPLGEVVKLQLLPTQDDLQGQANMKIEEEAAEEFPMTMKQKGSESEKEEVPTSDPSPSALAAFDNVSMHELNNEKYDVDLYNLQDTMLYSWTSAALIPSPGDIGGGANMSILGSPPSSTVLALSSTSPLFGIPVSKPMSPTSSDVKGKGRNPSTPLSYMDHLMSPDQELNEPQPDVQPNLPSKRRRGRPRKLDISDFENEAQNLLTAQSSPPESTQEKSTPHHQQQQQQQQQQKPMRQTIGRAMPSPLSPSQPSQQLAAFIQQQQKNIQQQQQQRKEQEQEEQHQQQQQQQQLQLQMLLQQQLQASRQALRTRGQSDQFLSIPQQIQLQARLNAESSSPPQHPPTPHPPPPQLRDAAMSAENERTGSAQQRSDTSSRSVGHMYGADSTNKRIEVSRVISGPQLQIGREINGVVDGVFDAGYMLTALVNGQPYRGVLFTPVNSLPPPGPTVLANPVTQDRRQLSSPLSPQNPSFNLKRPSSAMWQKHASQSHNASLGPQPPATQHLQPTPPFFSNPGPWSRLVGVGEALPSLQSAPESSSTPHLQLSQQSREGGETPDPSSRSFGTRPLTPTTALEMARLINEMQSAQGAAGVSNSTSMDQSDSHRRTQSGSRIQAMPTSNLTQNFNPSTENDQGTGGGNSGPRGGGCWIWQPGQGPPSAQTDTVGRNGGVTTPPPQSMHYLPPSQQGFSGDSQNYHHARSGVAVYQGPLLNYQDVNMPVPGLHMVQNPTGGQGGGQQSHNMTQLRHDVASWERV